ncbi:orotidine-5'-phosphate decarboxylase [Acinetobacter qingfengensis]|uniref:Orotidine 5'-phosphate decarboxylase n=1 Tax=Acinetobacter qingfengensis TaxID=1262585 RepID=A0A1E7R5I5_9GAMM|nr:orotidine-5'-phosphate decarboxylase [Acinetobacter qingfengensis]KAA8735604.1 orotidine-5'-phosphate decarboxylase [Acinetobacter qingfengensis]OEY94629.1 orotidine 5'-phosphate decarboxylase [Acinetobacter qingfengensis]
MSIIVALDVHNHNQALALADQLDPKLCRLKVGKELFTLVGPQILQSLHDRGFDIFLDLKFHDIPNTTAQAVLAAADLGVWMVNVHAMGGRKMMETCVERLQKHQHKTQLIAVTVLTSIAREDLIELGLDVEPKDQVLKLAKLTQDCGLDGVVCSAQEAPLLRQITLPRFQLVTPGIRPLGSNSDDQKRIVTPQQAIQDGATHLVIGRPITKSDDPSHTLQEIYNSIH